MARESITKALHEYDQTFLDCRDLRHPWKLLGFYREPGTSGVRRELVCERCGTTRTDIWDRRGNRLDNRYKYPKGYQLPEVNGERASNERIRKEILNRVTIFSSHDEMVAAAFGGSRNRRSRSR